MVPGRCLGNGHGSNAPFSVISHITPNQTKKMEIAGVVDPSWSRVCVSAGGAPLSLWSARSLGHGAVLWDASLALAHAIMSPALASLFFLRDDGVRARVLELGAGMALPSLVAAVVHACSVVTSDRAPYFPLLAANAAQAAGLVLPVILEWGANLKRLPSSCRGPFDVVLASDVLGCADEHAFSLLIKTFGDVFAANGNAVVLTSYRYRAPWESHFFELLRDRGWLCDAVTEYSTQDIECLRQQWITHVGADGCIEDASFSELRSGITIFKISLPRVQR